MNKQEYIEMLQNRIAGLNDKLEKLQLQAKLAEMEYGEDLQSEIKRFQDNQT